MSKESARVYGGSTSGALHLNTPRLIQDQNGNAVWRNDNTEPFGDSVPNSDPNNTGNVFDFPLRFPAQYFDRETNVAYNNYRDYDSGIGRYVESDLVGLRGGLNTYAYVDKPIRYSDPSGLWMPWTHKMMTVWNERNARSLHPPCRS